MDFKSYFVLHFVLQLFAKKEGVEEVYAEAQMFVCVWTAEQRHHAPLKSPMVFYFYTFFPFLLECNNTYEE